MVIGRTETGGQVPLSTHGNKQPGKRVRHVGQVLTMLLRGAGDRGACPLTYLRGLVLVGWGVVAFGQGSPVKLSLAQAEAMALQNHPEVLAAQNAVSAAGQQVAEAKSSYYPVVAGDLTGSAANQEARIGAGFLTDSRLFNRVGQGINVTQLITDSGRTKNLLASARSQQSAVQQTYQATRYDILMRVNQAYFGVLRAQATIRTAKQTIATRQTSVDQVTALANNNLRSQLDVTFVEVNLSEAKLLLLEAQDQEQEAYAELTRAIGAQQNAIYMLAEEPVPASPPADPETLVAQAMNGRPEIASLRLQLDSANQFERAEHDLKLPTVSLTGVGGYIDWINQITLPRVIPNEYGGGAVNVHVPIFNGHLFSAREQAAHFQAQEAEQRLRNEQQAVARDVRTAWARASTAYQRIDVTTQMLRQATQSLSLAQGRYDLGLSSIVELTQAQLNQTEAEIASLAAKFDYQAIYSALQYAIGALR